MVFHTTLYMRLLFLLALWLNVLIMAPLTRGCDLREGDLLDLPEHPPSQPQLELRYAGYIVCPAFIVNRRCWIEVFKPNMARQHHVLIGLNFTDYLDNTKSLASYNNADEFVENPFDSAHVVEAVYKQLKADIDAQSKAYVSTHVALTRLVILRAMESKYLLFL